MSFRKGKRKFKDPLKKKNKLVVVAIGNGFNSSNGNPQTMGPYKDKEKLLIIGDGDFSFSLALATAFGGKNIFATSFDSESTLREKYISGGSNADWLRAMKATVKFNVDGTKLEEQEWLASLKFNRIIFNFPHIGTEGGIEKSIKANQKLLYEFFYSSSHFLDDEDGEIHVALRTSSFYARWKIVEQAEKAGLKLIKTEDFKAKDFVGYSNTRTVSGKLFRQAPSTDDAKIYMFQIDSTKPRPSKEDISLQDEKKEQEQHNFKEDEEHISKDEEEHVEDQEVQNNVDTKLNNSDFNSKKRKRSSSVQNKDSLSSKKSKQTPTFPKKNKKKKRKNH